MLVDTKPLPVNFFAPVRKTLLSTTTKVVNTGCVVHLVTRSGVVAQVNYIGPSGQMTADRVPAAEGRDIVSPELLGGSALNVWLAEKAAMTPTAVLDAGLVRQALEHILPAVSTDITRETMCYVQIRGGTWSGTDGHRAHYADHMGTPTDWKAVPLHAEAAGLALAALRYCGRSARVSVMRRHDGAAAIRVWGDGLDMVVRCVPPERDLPDTAMVRPETRNYAGAHSGSVKRLRATLKTAPTHGEFKCLTLCAHGPELMAGGGTGLPSDDHHLGIASSEVIQLRPLNVSAKYLREAVDALPAKAEVHLYCGGTYFDPILVQSDGLTAVVMPTRL